MGGINDKKITVKGLADAVSPFHVTEGLFPLQKCMYCMKEIMGGMGKIKPS